MGYSRQGRAITGRRQYNPGGISRRPPYYPKQVEEVPSEIPQGIMPFQPAIISKPKPLLNPPGDMDISAGLPEGFSNTSGFAPIDAMNEAGNQFGKGNYGKGSVALGRGMLGMIAAPIEGVYAMAKPVVDLAKKGVTGLLGLNAPANSGSAVASGSGMIGLSGPMGLAQAESANNAPDLADLDIGDFGGGDDSMGGMGGLGDTGASVGGDEGDF